MEIIKKKLHKNYKLVVFSDLHLGSPCVNLDTIKEMVRYVDSEEHIYAANIGDNVEAITPSDKRFYFSNCEFKTVQQQCDIFVD